MPRRMAPGPVGGHGLPAHQGGKAGQGSATTLHLKMVGQPAWAQPPRLTSAEN